jgi:hypothetical protein
MLQYNAVLRVMELTVDAAQVEWRCTAASTGSNVAV